ncbi:MAG TPA: homoserine dehydrogenase, partial [Candidatus Omnitrophota bacterium]|nr:homoserine dehydrogenase [Candidatus Omnitrophota bacterium]
MEKFSVADIALVGLGEVGGRFFEEMLKLKERGIKIVCVAELDDTPGRRHALEMGIPLKTLEEIAGMGHAVDVVFDLTGSPSVRKWLREKMQETGNRHTIIAPETMARLLWAVVS